MITSYHLCLWRYERQRKAHHLEAHRSASLKGEKESPLPKVVLWLAHGLWHTLHKHTCTHVCVDMHAITAKIFNTKIEQDYHVIYYTTHGYIPGGSLVSLQQRCLHIHDFMALFTIAELMRAIKLPTNRWVDNENTTYMCILVYKVCVCVCVSNVLFNHFKKRM